jgi:hypothetical protein
MSKECEYKAELLVIRQEFKDLQDEHKAFKDVLERIRDWEYTSKGSCDILRGFARNVLKDN